MGVFQNHLMAGAVASTAASSWYDYNVAQSCRFTRASSTKLVRANAFTAVTTFTFSSWIKRGALDGNVQYFAKFDNNKGIAFNGDNKITIYNGSAHSVGDAVFRDVSSWMHVVLKVTSGTGQLYVNNDTLHTNTGMELQGGADSDTIGIGVYGTDFFDGYLAETIIIDGSALNPTSFAESSNGVWRPIDPSDLTFGSNGAWLKYEDSGDFGNDSSGNNNDYTASNLGADHQVQDSPTFS